MSRASLESSPGRRVLFATANPHKLEEVRAILAPHGVEVLGLADVVCPDGRRGDEIPEPLEDGHTFEENARIKARAYARATGRPCLADDSGLEVEALGGHPGVESAYFAHGAERGPSISRSERDPANNERLLRLMQGVSDSRRTARFVCVMCIAAPDGDILAESRGEFVGRIGREPRGENGFGYDPLLVLEDGRTSAELPTEEKNARSHRGEAARGIAPRLAEIAKSGRLT